MTSEQEDIITQEYEQIVPWNGTNDTGRDVRLKWKRNFERVNVALKSLLDMLPDLVKRMDMFIRKDREDKTEHLVRFFNGLEYGLYAGNAENGGKLHSDGMAELGKLLVNGESSFKGNMSSEAFVSGFTAGHGWSIQMKNYLNAAGVQEQRSVMEVDDLTVRGTIRVFEFIVSQLLGENDNRIFTGMMEVDHYDASSKRVYISTQCGKLYNSFRTGDILIVQQFGGLHSDENKGYITKQYELLVTKSGIGNIEEKENRTDWIEFSNFSTPTENGKPENLIKKGDTLVRIDSKTDPSRKGIIELVSVGDAGPYMDVVYGRKTDPAHALKTRIGNLGGVRSPLFGWLAGWGAYVGNLYAVGEYRQRSTGEDLDMKIEQLKERFMRMYRRQWYELDGENLLHDAIFADWPEGWEAIHEGPEFVTVNGAPLVMNRSTLTVRLSVVSPEERNGRLALHVANGGVRQGNGFIRKPGKHTEYRLDEATGTVTETEVEDTLYLTLRGQFVTGGTLWMGFTGNRTEEGYLQPLTTYVDADGGEERTFALSGKWDGSGDFLLEYGGDMYVTGLSLTVRPIEDYRQETRTWMEQTDRRIGLHAESIGRQGSEIERLTTDVYVEGGVFSVLSARVSENTEAIGAARTDLGQLTVAMDGIRSTVTSVGGGLEEAKQAAERAQQTADAAVADAASAYGLAQTADGNATANATAISQNATAIAAVAARFNEDGSLKDRSGLVTTAGFAELFSEAVSTEGVMRRADMGTYVQYDPATGQITTGIKLMADKIDLSGYTTINGFSIDTSGYFRATGGSIGGLNIDTNGIGSDGEGFVRIAPGYVSVGGPNGTSLVMMDARDTNSGASLIVNPKRNGEALRLQGLLTGLKLPTDVPGQNGCSYATESKIVCVTNTGVSVYVGFGVFYNGVVAFINAWDVQYTVSGVNGCSFRDPMGKLVTTYSATRPLIVVYASGVAQLHFTG